MARAEALRGRPLARRSRRAAAPRPWPRRLARRLLLLSLLAGALAAAYLLWLRDSSLVAVRDVQVGGLRAGNAERVRNALELAARDMTVLHVRRRELEQAARPFPTVKSLRVGAAFPSTLRIRVTEHVPTSAIRAGGRSILVAADGTLLHGMTAKGRRLPLLALRRIPPTRALADPGALAQARILGAAPAPLRPELERTYESSRGWTVRGRGGLKLYFGDDRQAARKWAAASRILADPETGALAYIDLRSPRRPAAG